MDTFDRFFVDPSMQTFEMEEPRAPPVYEVDRTATSFEVEVRAPRHGGGYDGYGGDSPRYGSSTDESGTDEE